MADEIQEGTQTPAPQEDRLKNLQAEFDRKTTNLNDKLSQINAQLQQLSQLSAPAQSRQPENRPDAVLDPEGYERYMEAKLESKMNSKIESQQRQQAELGSLVSMYPELQDNDSDLTREALQAYNSMSPSDKANPLAYRTAIQSAALNLGLLPKHKRQQKSQVQNESDDIGASSQPVSRQQSKKQGKLDPATLAFAQALGRDTSDPEYLKRLEKHSQREVWGRYKRPTK
jgi:hypothetical protein